MYVVKNLRAVLSDDQSPDEASEISSSSSARFSYPSRRRAIGARVRLPSAYIYQHLPATACRITGRLQVDTGFRHPSRARNSASLRIAGEARDPEMHQTKKGNQWYFGMKAHFGVDSRSKLIHAVQTTPAHVADNTVLPDLLHGNETCCGATRPTAASGQ
jgi:IS5 family transposase